MVQVILLQAPAQGSATSFYVMMGLMILIFYVFMIRPQQKKAREQKKFIEGIQKGDYVVTIGGAHGRVAELDGDTVVLEVEKGGRIRFNKSAISLENTRAAQKK